MPHLTGLARAKKAALKRKAPTLPAKASAKAKAAVLKRRAPKLGRR